MQFNSCEDEYPLCLSLYSLSYFFLLALSMYVFQMLKTAKRPIPYRRQVLLARDIMYERDIVNTNHNVSTEVITSIAHNCQYIFYYLYLSLSLRIYPWIWSISLYISFEVVHIIYA